MTKVLKFPENKIVRQTQVDIKAIEEAKERSLFAFADNIMDDLVENLVSDIESNGIDIEDDSFLKDFSLTVDALRATIYRTFKLPHTLHSFIDENVKVINRETGEIVERFENLNLDESKE